MITNTEQDVESMDIDNQYQVRRENKHSKRHNKDQNNQGNFYFNKINYLLK